MKKEQTFKFTATELINTVRKLSTVIEPAYVKTLKEVLNALNEKYAGDSNDMLNMLMGSLEAYEKERDEVNTERENAVLEVEIATTEQERKQAETRMATLTRRLVSLDKAISKHNKDIEKLQDGKTKFKINAAERVFEALVAMLDESYTVVQFKDTRIFSFTKTLAGAEKKTYTSLSIPEFVGYFVKVDPRSRVEVRHIISTILKEYPIGNVGDIFESKDKTAKSEAIEFFAKAFDAQVGKGGFASYFLYPKLYNEEDFDLKRTQVIGTISKAGKSLLIKMLSALYGPMSRIIMPRPIASESGYDKNVHDWNTANKDILIGLIDDDKQEKRSRVEFFKNVYNPNSFEYREGGDVKYTTFRGHFYSNMNVVDPCLRDTENYVQNHRRVYFYNLFIPAKRYMPDEYLDELASYKQDSDVDALLNYLSEHEEDALNWLRDYDEKYEPTDFMLDDRTEDEIKEEQKKAESVNEVLNFMYERMLENKSHKMHLSTVKKNFYGEPIRITQGNINEWGDGYFVCTTVRVPDGDGPGEPKLGVKLAPGIDIKKDYPELMEVPEPVHSEAEIEAVIRRIKGETPTREEVLDSAKKIGADNLSDEGKAIFEDILKDDDEARAREKATVGGLFGGDKPVSIHEKVAVETDTTADGIDFEDDGLAVDAWYTEEDDAKRMAEEKAQTENATVDNPTPKEHAPEDIVSDELPCVFDENAKQPDNEKESVDVLDIEVTDEDNPW